VPSLVDENGHFKSLANLIAKNISFEELEREWTAQIERFISSGLKPPHFDSHHHVHTLKEFCPVVKRLSEKFGLPVRRNGSISIDGVESLADLSLFDFYGEGVTPDYFTNLPAHLEDGLTVEIMCHPAYLDNILLNDSSYTYKRLVELDVLTSVNLPESIDLL
jgi:predicted glycoside hydrolase/deacetylase ChbG (UPF0249 family)